MLKMNGKLKRERWSSLTCVFVIGAVIGQSLKLSMFMYRPGTTCHERTRPGAPKNNNSSGTAFERQPVVYGHVHIAKTAGTSINGELASHFDRVCGQKGYSYDAYQFNQRLRQSPQTSFFSTENTGDLINKVSQGYNRGRVPMNVMLEIGFEDCDLISFEDVAKFWHQISKTIPLELHIPCRDPVKHLMSMCLHKSVTFHCDSEKVEKEIDSCILSLDRFSQSFFEDSNITSVKCFDPIPIKRYENYMSNLLERKRIENDYVFRDTNSGRTHRGECIWSDSDLQSKVRKILIEKHEYFRWCDICRGSSNDLFPVN